MNPESLIRKNEENRFSELDSRTPGGVYLCQVSDTVSCGACCGLYNMNGLSIGKLNRILENRTRLFGGVERNPDAIDRFAGEMMRGEFGKEPIKDFHHCPFIGFIGSEKATAGCLLHPLGEGNKGIDWRGLSYYGGYACRTYFCPACSELPGRYKRILRRAAGNWYDYGLMITETAMLDNFFENTEKRIGRNMDETDIAENSSAIAVLRRFLEIKTFWPFHQNRPKGLVNFFFNGREFQPPSIDFQRLGVDTSRWAPVLTALWSDLPSPETLKKAEFLMDGMVDELARAMGE